jgi:two-component system nitrogen regulation response regulator GlnG
MPMAAQTRLLRVLAAGKFFRVGGSNAINANVRIVAATHRSLQSLVETGKFREDLYHRLNVVKIDLPPLRERKQDIQLLTQYFLQTVASEMTVPQKKLKSEVIILLQNHSWPGNVRELENLCRWLTVMATGINLGVTDLPANFKNETHNKQDWKVLFESFIEDELVSKNHKSMVKCQQEFEQLLLSTVLKHTHGHRQKTAEILGWGRNTVTRKLKNITQKNHKK